MNDDAFLRAFEATDFPLDRWHHREHIKVAYLYLLRHPFLVALDKMRHCIHAYNTAHDVPNSLTSGYHETLTKAWLQLVYLTICEYGACASADEFVDSHPQLLSVKALRFFYSRERVVSAEAKRSFVEPDLAQLPSSKKIPPMPKYGVEF